MSVDREVFSADAEREEDDATSVGAKQTRLARLMSCPLEDYAVDLLCRVEVGARGGWPGAQWALQRLEVGLDLADAGACADRLLDALGDGECFLQA